MLKYRLLLCWSKVDQITLNIVTVALGASSGAVNMYAPTGSNVMIDIVRWYV